MNKPENEYITPGEFLYGDGDLALNEAKQAISLEVTNTGDRAIQIGSHYHFFEVNSALRFPRDASFSMHLDIPSGTSTRFEAGQTHTVALVPFGGTQRLLGFHGFAAGEDHAAARARAIERGFDLDGGAR